MTCGALPPRLTTSGGPHNAAHGRTFVAPPGSGVSVMKMSEEESFADIGVRRHVSNRRQFSVRCFSSCTAARALPSTEVPGWHARKGYSDLGARAAYERCVTNSPLAFGPPCRAGLLFCMWLISRLLNITSNQFQALWRLRRLAVQRDDDFHD